MVTFAILFGKVSEIIDLYRVGALGYCLQNEEFAVVDLECLTMKLVVFRKGVDLAELSHVLLECIVNCVDNLGCGPDKDRQ